MIGRYGGVVEKFIGDAVMAVWGVPVAHEDDAQRAVRAGLELVAAVAALGEEVGAPGLAMRVGRRDRRGRGHGRRHRARAWSPATPSTPRPGCSAAAEPGQVWVDETTRALTSAAITFTDAGEHALKGKAEPMRLWRGRRRGGRPRRRPAGRRARGAADRARPRAAAGQGAVPRDRGVGPARGWSSSTARPAAGSPGWPGSSRSTSTG